MSLLEEIGETAYMVCISVLNVMYSCGRENTVLRTQGHVLVVMLAMKLRLELERLWHDKELTVEEGIKETATLCFTEVIKDNTEVCNTVPEPRPSVKSLLDARSTTISNYHRNYNCRRRDAAKINLPTVMPWSGVNVATRKKLVPRRN